MVDVTVLIVKMFETIFFNKLNTMFKLIWWFVLKAMVLYNQDFIENKPLKYVDIDKPVPRSDEVLIEIYACGVCRTDLHIVEGNLPLVKKPIIPGHQVVGKVVDTGENVVSVDKGALVGVAWLYWSCSECKYCRRDLENLCDKALFTGYSVDGGYAEYMVAKDKFVYPLKTSLDYVEASPLLCAGAIGYRALKHTGLLSRGEGILGLFGFGSSAYLTLLLAKKIGLKVYVFTHTRWKIDEAFKLGADWAGDTYEEISIKLDASIVYAPSSRVLIEALKKTDRSGRVVIGEIYMEPIEKLDYKLIWFEKEIKTVANVTRRDVIEFLNLVEKYGIRPRVKTYRLSEANEALEELKKTRTIGQIALRIR